MLKADPRDWGWTKHLAGINGTVEQVYAFFTTNSDACAHQRTTKCVCLCSESCKGVVVSLSFPFEQADPVSEQEGSVSHHQPRERWRTIPNPFAGQQNTAFAFCHESNK